MGFFEAILGRFLETSFLSLGFWHWLANGTPMSGNRPAMFEKSTLLCSMPFPSVRHANPPQRVLLSPLLHYAPFYIQTQRTPAACISMVCPFPASKQFFSKFFLEKAFIMKNIHIFALDIHL